MIDISVTPQVLVVSCNGAPVAAARIGGDPWERETQTSASISFNQYPLLSLLLSEWISAEEAIVERLK